MASASRPSAADFLSDQVWRGEEMAHGEVVGVTTGFALLDAELPGGGWPVGALTEVLHAAPEAHTWQLLLPALAQAVQNHGGPVALVGAPYTPFTPALAAQGLPAEALLWVRSDAPAARLWACEQSLRCADVAAVLAWLPQARVSELRRLQLAASQHDSLLWVFRPDTVVHASSPARLRLQVTACRHDAGQLEVRILKRRGPPLSAPLLLPSGSGRLAAVLAASRARRAGQRERAAANSDARLARDEVVVRIGVRPLVQEAAWVAPTMTSLPMSMATPPQPQPQPLDAADSTAGEGFSNAMDRAALAA